ncbi:DUF4442 domain-containing protein [Streptomyces griseocarneus]|nr:DUF4442 domain-containing protein [Streptomyces griseocarneus]
MEEIRAFINELVPFQKHVGADVIAIGDDCATAVLPDSADTLNHVGTRHAGALFLVAEAAAGAALAGALAEWITATVFVLRESRMTYRRKARGEIRAVAEFPGRELRSTVRSLAAGERFEATVTSSLQDGEGECVAEAEFTYHCRVRLTEPSGQA